MPLTDAQKTHMQIVVEGTLAAGGGQAQKTVNILYYERTLFSATFVATNLITAFHTRIKTNWKAVANLQWTWDKTRCRVLNSPTEAYVDVTVAEAGSVTGECEPGHVAMLISKKTALRGRSYQGRMYLCGVPESGAINNELTSAHKTLLDTVAADVLATLTDSAGITYRPVVFSQLKSNLEADPSTVFATPLSAATARKILARMDSRASKVLS